MEYYGCITEKKAFYKSGQSSISTQGLLYTTAQFPVQRNITILGF
jgi:hypothetical protein